MSDALFVRHASVEAIESALSNARAEEQLARTRVTGLEVLLETRLGQIERGEWPGDRRAPSVRGAATPEADE